MPGFKIAMQLSAAGNGKAQIDLLHNEAYTGYIIKKHCEKIQDCQCKSKLKNRC